MTITLQGGSVWWWLPGPAGRKLISTASQVLTGRSWSDREYIFALREEGRRVVLIVKVVSGQSDAL